MEQTISKTNLMRLLHDGTVYVTFMKKDGTRRPMKCTLAEGLIQPYEKKTERVKETNEDIIAVWDLDNNAWRSFRYDSVIEVHK